MISGCFLSAGPDEETDVLAGLLPDTIDVVDKMPLDAPPPRTSRFGSPLVLSRVHWVRPELVIEVKFLTWTQEGLLRQVIYQGPRQDKLATDVRRTRPR